ncbi:UBP1-associated protein 2A-like [Impatiens glandulifera]|uniref:UBP1-associated protein 2A-like n=1 Tax=Impatiens glandulifera TaxID=253017 RepID=UPI001FB15B9F|nr:UBP1-associated protein 2A-like [Impatiens glandulifera]
MNTEESSEEDEEEESDEEPIEKILESLGKDQLIVLVKEAVSKLPDIIESIQRLADSYTAHRNIFVHGLDWDSKEETIIRVFSKYGEIESCEVLYNKVGRSKGYCFILFKHRSGARKALKHPHKKIDNRLTSCHLASAGPVPAPPPVDPPSSDCNQRTIFVRNASPDIDPLKLTEFFARYGEIEDGPKGLNKHTGKFKGFCFFVYKSIESYRKALEEPNKIFEGKILQCYKRVDVPKSNKPNQHLSGPTPEHLIEPFRHALGFNPTVAAPTLVPNSNKPNQHLSGPTPESLIEPFRHALGFNPTVAAPTLVPKSNKPNQHLSGPTPENLIEPFRHALGFNPTIAAPTLVPGPSIRQILDAIRGSEGDDFEATMNQIILPKMNNPGYGNQVGASYGGSQPVYINQDGYQDPQSGQGSTWPASGGASNMGHGQ